VFSQGSEVIYILVAILYFPYKQYMFILRASTIFTLNSIIWISPSSCSKISKTPKFEL